MVDMYRVRTVFTGVAGSPWYSNHYFTVDQTTPASAISAVNGFWGGLVGYISDEVTISVRGEVLTIQSETGQAVGAAALSNVNFIGTNSGEKLPLATQGLVTWQTGSFQSGRRVIGKTFIPGLGDLANDEGAPSTFFRGAVQAAADAYIAYQDSNPCIWSKKNGTAPLVTGATPATFFGVLRSRRD